MQKERLIGSNYRRGQSVVELVVAMGIAAIVVGGAIGVVWIGRSMALDAELHNRALAYARANLEAAQALGQSNWQALGASSSTEDLFLKEVLVQTQGTYTKKVTSRVSWQTSPMRPLKVELTTLVTDAKGAYAVGGDTGGGGVSGDWRNPQTLGSVDLGPGISATDIDVVGTVAYVSSQASVKSRPDIFSFNVQNPASPVQMHSLDLDAYASVSLDASGSHASNAAIGVIPDLKTVNITNPASMSLTSEYNVITFVDALSVFRSGNYAFLGVHRTGFNGELFAINVSNPASPSQTGVFEVNGDVNDIYVNGNYAFIATSRDDAELMVVDISNPASMQQIGFLNLTGTGDATSVFAAGNSVFLGTGSRFHYINASNPVSPTVLGSGDTAGTVNDIYVQENLAFLATSDSNREFQAWDVSNPVSMSLWSSFNFPQVATGIDYQDNKVYVSVRSNDGLRIITAQ